MRTNPIPRSQLVRAEVKATAANFWVYGEIRGNKITRKYKGSFSSQGEAEYVARYPALFMYYVHRRRLKEVT